MTAPWYEDDSATVRHGDCLDVMATLPDECIDAIVTDPPYGLGFMGKAWDDLPPGLPWARECLRVLKPGGHLLAFGGTRTWHRLACAVEDAGFEVRDSIAWLYGSGFPKSLDVSKAIDKAAGATREMENYNCGYAPGSNTYLDTPGHRIYREAPGRTPATPAAQQWQGWGTALKPAFEPVVVARKPLIGTVAANVLAHGTGALNVDGCRISGDVPHTQGGMTSGGMMAGSTGERRVPFVPSTAGRWPTNVVLDGDAAAELDEQSGTSTSRRGAGPLSNTFLLGGCANLAELEALAEAGGPTPDGRNMARSTLARYHAARAAEAETGGNRQRGHTDSGGASRFFPVFRYQAKAPTRERVSYVKEGADGSVSGSPAKSGWRCNVCGNQTVPPGGKPWPACGHDDWERFETENRTVNKVAHPTVKPLALMRWLVRLVTPPGGVVLDPFAGSGTTVEAAILEGFQVIGIEREADYLPLIEARIARNQTTSEGLPTVAEALALFDFEEPA